MCGRSHSCKWYSQGLNQPSGSRELTLMILNLNFFYFASCPLLWLYYGDLLTEAANLQLLRFTLNFLALFLPPLKPQA